MSQSKTIGLICGGSSVEHEVALQSAVFVAKSILDAAYGLEVFVISKQGTWLRLTDITAWIEQQPNAQSFIGKSEAITPIFGQADRQWQTIADPSAYGQLDVIVPIIHGKGGEDGSIQGLCQFWQLPFVGPNIEDAVITFDKILAKTLLQKNNLPVVPWVEVAQQQGRSLDTIYDETIARLPSDWSYPLFVKVARGGSSIGVHKVHQMSELKDALIKAFQVEDQLIIEPGIAGREIECAVLIGDTIEVAGPGELQVHADYYSYEAKYHNADACSIVLEADLSDALADHINETAKQACAVIGCQSMARVDLFVTASGDLYINEINSIPGFTQISMFPKLWETAGVQGAALISRLITQAINDFNHQNNLADQALAYTQQVIAL